MRQGTNASKYLIFINYLISKMTEYSMLWVTNILVLVDYQMLYLFKYG